MFKLFKGLEGPRAEGAPRTSLLKSLRTVLWGFLGVRRRSDHSADSPSVTPLQVIAVAVAAVALFVVCLILLVRHIAG